MRQFILFLITATAGGAVLAIGGGCGDNLHGGGVGPSDAGVGTDSGSNGGDDGGPIDMGPPSCNLAWNDLEVGTDLDDQIFGMTTDANHNVYAVGYEHGVNGVSSNNLDPSGDSRGVVMKIDPTGQIRWKTVIDTDSTDTVEDIALDPDSGMFYVVGRTYGAFDGFVNQGQFDTYLAALDANGKVMKVFQTGDERPQHPVRLNLGPNYQIAVAGYDDTYIQTNFVVSRDDGFLGSFNRAAPPDTGFTQNFVQKVPLSVNILNRITGVALERDGSGAMYVTSLITGGAQRGIYVKKYNSDGSIAWSHQITNLSPDAANAVGLSPSGDLFVTGATFATLGAMAFGQQDAFLLKMDKATGNVVWAAQAGGPDTDYPTAMAFDADGNIYIAGYSFGSVVAGTDNQGGLDAFAMKFDPSGKLLSAWEKGTAEDEIVTSMTVDACGKAYVGGYTKGALVDSTKSTAGGFDMFVLRAAL